MTVENLDIQISQSGSDAARQMDKLANSIGKIKAPTASVSKGVKKLSSSFSAGSTAVGKFVKSLGRIAFYRAIRTIVKEITQSFKEGLVNAYQFSKGLNGSLAAALDGIATKSLTMKNQLGSAFGGLLQAIQPILLRIISLITQAANAIAAFFGALNGGTYLKAKDTATAWNEATGAANKYKNTILGFDEINKLDDNSGGGGGGANPMDMFEEVKAPEWMQSIADKIKDFNQKLKITVDDVLFDWKNLTGEQIAEKCFAGLAALVGGAAGFAIGGVPGAIVGTFIGATLGILFDTFHFNHDGKLDASEFAGVLLPGIAGAAGLLFGGIVGGVAMFTLGASLTLYFDRMKTVWKNVDMDAVYPFLSDGWIAQKIKKAKENIEVGFNTRIKPIFQKPFWQKTIEEFDDLFYQLFQAPLEEAQEAFPEFIDAIDLKITTFLDNAGQAIKDKLEEVKGWIEQKWEDFKKWWEGLSLEAFKIKLPHFTATGKFSLDPPSVPKISVDWYANGGFPSRGDLFIAGERGAELVSSHGGQTQVSNTDQIANSVLQGNSVVVDAIDAMADAVVRAISNKNTNVYLDSKQIRNGQNRLSRAMG